MSKIDNILAINKFTLGDKIQLIQANLTHRVKALRKIKKLSQVELAERSGVSLGSIKRFENTGMISLDSLLMIAFAMGCANDFNQLFSYNEQLDRVKKKMLEP